MTQTQTAQNGNSSSPNTAKETSPQRQLKRDFNATHTTDAHNDDTAAAQKGAPSKGKYDGFAKETETV